MYSLNGIVRRVMVRTTHGRFLRDVGKVCLPKAKDPLTAALANKLVLGFLVITRQPL